MSVFDKIKAQQPKQRTDVWMVGEQLADMIRDSQDMQDIVDRDLDIKEMSLKAAAAKIKEYADKHKTGNFACVTPPEADRIIREFYGLPLTVGARLMAQVYVDEPADPPAAADQSTKAIDLSAFF